MSGIKERTSSDHFLANRLHVLLLAALCTCLWGSAVPAVKIGYEWFAIAAGDVAGKHVFAGFRFFCSGIMLLAFYAVSGIRERRRWEKLSADALPLVFLLAFFQTFLEYAVYYVGLANTTGIRATILNPVSAFFALFLAHFLVPGERLTAPKAIGSLIGFSGIILNTLSGGEAGGGFRLDGEGLLLLSSFSFAVGSIINNRSKGRISPVLLNAYQLTIGGAGLLLLGLLCGGSLNWNGIASVLLMLYLSLIPAVAFTIWSLLLQHNPVGEVSVYSFLQPIFGLVWTALILGESFWSVRTLVSLVLVCSGIYIVNRGLQPANSSALFHHSSHKRPAS